MKFKILLVCIFSLALSLSSFAQTTDGGDKTTQKEGYEELLKKVKGGDTSIDFQAMRFAYADTEKYSPYGCTKGRDEMFRAFRSKDYKMALKHVETTLGYCYVDMDAHYVAGISYRELKDAEKSEFHLAVLKKLIQSITLNGDGTSAKTAWTVISIPEEYTILAFLGYQRTTQSLLMEEGSRFDKLETFKVDNKDEKRDFYFNVDIVFKGYGKMFN